MACVGPLAALSVIATPMIARDRTFGAIFFATTALSRRRYGTRDLELAADVGRRAGHAIDHALLYQAAEEAARIRESLVAVVAHDLKNPVTTIDLALRVFLEDDHDHFPDDGEHKMELHAIGAIQRAAARMHRLIHDLLDLSRADEGRLSVSPAPADPLFLLDDALEAHSTLAAGRGIALEVAAAPSLPHVLADRERIAQVFSNLVGNAIEFTPQGGRVRMTALPGEGGVTFAVEDTGSGIAAEDLPHVFDRFWQAQKKSHGGTGLGLSIAEEPSSRPTAGASESRARSALARAFVSRSRESRPGLHRRGVAESPPGDGRAHPPGDALGVRPVPLERRLR